jgi:hypothetical protein
VINKRFSGLSFPLMLAMLAGSALVGMGQPRSARAATCTPIPGEPGDTAVIINPSSVVTGTIDATGCDYGVYVGPGHSAVVSGATIFGADEANVAVDGTATVTGSHLYASPDGIDFGEYSESPSNNTATNNTIEYTDDGCGVMVWGGKVTLTGNRITGPGLTPEPFGIDAFGDAVVIAIRNTVTNNETGLILDPIGPGSLVLLNTVQNNKTGIETSGINTPIMANTLSNNTTGIDPDGTGEKVIGNRVCASTNATPIETADASSPPTVSGNLTNC